MTAADDVVQTIPTFLALGITAKLARNITARTPKAHTQQANRWWR